MNLINIIIKISQKIYNRSQSLTKVNKNYCAPYQVTTYEDKKGEKITLKQFQKLKK